MPELVLQRRHATAQYFVEALGNGIGLDMVLINEGTFLMGSPEDELERDHNEGPQHIVNVSRFFVGRYPITQSQWRSVGMMPQVERELELAPSSFPGDDCPVENVSWYDAVEFCKRLSQHTGRFYRLPSEAEWEYACRAGTTTPFHFGKTITTNVANYDGDYVYDNGPKGIYRRKTTPVGMFIANAWGLCDMHGNVWEWCTDAWSENHENASSSEPTSMNEDGKTLRVRRGGSWDFNPGNCRSAFRDWDSPESCNNVIGFRVACNILRRS